MMIHCTFKSQRASSILVRSFVFYFFAAFAFAASANASTFHPKEFRLSIAAFPVSAFDREFPNTVFDAEKFSDNKFNARTFGQDFSLANFPERQNRSAGGFGDTSAEIFSHGIVRGEQFGHNFPSPGFNQTVRDFTGNISRGGFNQSVVGDDFDKANLVNVSRTVTFAPTFFREDFGAATFDRTSITAGTSASRSNFNPGDLSREFTKADFEHANVSKVSSVAAFDASSRSFPAVDDAFSGARFDGSFNQANFDRIFSGVNFNAFAKDFFSLGSDEPNRNFQNSAVRATFSNAQSEHQTEVAVLNYGPLRQPRNDRDLYHFGLDVRPIYYTEYSSSGGVLIGKRFQMSKDVKELVIYSEDPYVKRYVQQGQVVRILARAERGETLWIFVETSNHPGGVYAKTGLHNYGAVEKLQEFNSSTGDAYRMYFARAYGDTVLDLGYADYSKIAGKGEAIISVKKGDDPETLKTIQTITLAYK